MKKILFLLLWFPILVVAQTQTENYIKTNTYKVPTATSIVAPTILQANQNITYFDGLGRPIQQIAHQQSGSGKDIVTPIEYDAFGRQDKDYLPYASSLDASLNYKASALTEVGTFYNTPAYENTTNPYSQKLLEASPLNRVMKQAAPGTDWALNSGHEIKLDYQTNSASDAVKLFPITSNWDTAKGLYDIPTSLTPADYLEFQLYKTITFDENTAATPSESNGSTVEFKNKEGQVVLKRSFEASVKHDNYYVYDQYGNLTFVIPPLANAATTISNTILDDLCYQYKYDSRNRLVEKKLPGKQWEFIVYDKLDRPVATGPAFSPFGDGTIGWLITKYDVYSRVVYTGWYESTVNTTTRTSLQNDQNSLSTANYETKTSSGTIDSITAYYTNTVAPTSFKLLTVNYYDDYAFPNIPSIPTDVEEQNVLSSTKSLPTGSWARALTSTTSTEGETSTTFYDAKARPIRTYLTNYLGGYTCTDTNLDFSGVALYTKTYHKRLASDAELKIIEVFTYSPQGRLLTQTHQINDLSVQLLAENSYDEIGQLISKNVGNTTTMPLQKVDYTYNIRGWLTGINNDPTDNLVLNASEKDVFAFKINYNTSAGSVAGISPLYNGNISETYWRTSSDNVLRKYGYQYDNLNRLKNAIYQKPGGNTYPTYEDYSEKNITYDKNGNIQTLYRNGDLQNALPANCIDNLSYFYETNTNKLLKVSDSSNNTSGYKVNNKYGVFHTYDANGNLKTDKNKDISSIMYNHLNLPTLISVIVYTNVPKISYIYTANGVKLKKVYSSGTRIPTTNTTDYLEGFQYYNNVLQYFPTSEGYVKNTAGVYTYVYNYTDHLGNVRVSYQDINNDGTIANSEILEENNYYPFGLKHKGYNSNNAQPDYKYRYNSKEYQDELGLNVYDFGNRNYDSALGRFMNMDRFAEKYYHLNPYQYGANNPIIFNDIKGDSILIYSKQDKTNIKYDNGNLYSHNSKTGKWETYNGKNVKVDKNGNKTIGGFLGKAAAALDKIRSGKSGGELINTLQNDPKYVSIGEGSNQSGGVSGRVSWDPSNTTGGPNQQGRSNRPSYIGLTHELGHAFDGLDGLVSNVSIGNIGGENVTAAEYEAMHWENIVRGENGISLRTHYGNDGNGNVVGQALNPNGTSSIYTQQLVMPTAHLQAQFSSSGMQIVPVSGTTTVVIPFKY